MKDNKNKKKEEKKGKKKILLLLLLFFLLLLILFGVVRSGGLFLGMGDGIIKSGGFLDNILNGLQKEDVEVEKVREIERVEDSEIIEEQEVTEEVTETEETIDIETTIMEDGFKFEEDEEMESENYSVANVKFGGTAIVKDENIEGVALEVGSVNSEILPASNPDLVNVLVTWKTNKTSIAELRYAKKSGDGGATIREARYGIDHGIFIENLDLETEYVYKIDVRDKRGRTASTEYYSFYTGNPGGGNGIVGKVKDTLQNLFQ
ncbi:hypothetical protein ACFL2R_03235 [Patescibacteria group bacterium]